MRTLSNGWTRSQRLAPRFASDEARAAPLRSQIEASVSAEQVTYNNRFDIVINTYRQIIRNWESAVETEYQSYEQLLTQFQEAVKQDEEQADEQEETAEMAKELRSLFSNPREIDTLAKVGTKYSSAKEAVIKCGGID
jgi:DNA repair ATPase RecN